LSIQGGGRRNNYFIATDDKVVLAENSRLKMGKLLFNHALRHKDIIHLRILLMSCFGKNLHIGGNTNERQTVV
jgi:hypothetical protein